VANGADRPLLLLDGEELIGAKQNRILNTTVLVAAHTEVTIPVSCVAHHPHLAPEGGSRPHPVRTRLSWYRRQEPLAC